MRRAGPDVVMSNHRYYTTLSADCEKHFKILTRVRKEMKGNYC